MRNHCIKSPHFKAFQIKYLIFFLGFFFVFGCFGPQAKAQNLGLYIPGLAGGINSGVQPPPGVYFVPGLYQYYSTGIKDENGNTLLSNLSLDLTAPTGLFGWVSPYKILGANWGMNFLLYGVNPVLDFDTVVGVGRNSSSYGIGDVYFEPFVLGWNRPRFGIIFSYGFYAPTGRFTPGANDNIGRGTWTHQFNLGGTVFFDKARTWSLTNWIRGEVHHNTRDEDLTIGSHIYWEWALNKTFVRILDVGPVGYAAWQVTEDTGADAPANANIKDRVYGVGGELGITIPRIKSRLSFRGYGEFDARLRTQGVAMVFNLAVALWNYKPPPESRPPGGSPPQARFWRH